MTKLFIAGCFLIAALLFYTTVIKKHEKSFDYYEEVESFRQMALKYKTDKVTSHSYQDIYGLYFPSLRNKSIQLLEIGIGCGMAYGPGKSLELWKEYFPYAKISFVDFDSECALKFQHLAQKIFIGSQTDLAFISHIANNRNKYYDIIIDDGGHSKKMQIYSLIGLWSALKPRGIYVIEDTHFQFVNGTSQNDMNTSILDVMFYLINKFNYRTTFLPDKWVADKIDSIHSSVLSINCFSEACVLIKK